MSVIYSADIKGGLSALKHEKKMMVQTLHPVELPKPGQMCRHPLWAWKQQRRQVLNAAPAAAGAAGFITQAWDSSRHLAPSECPYGAWASKPGCITSPAAGTSLFWRHHLAAAAAATAAAVSATAAAAAEEPQLASQGSLHNSRPRQDCSCCAAVDAGG